jgi:hypothetical protein
MEKTKQTNFVILLLLLLQKKSNKGLPWKTIKNKIHGFNLLKKWKKLKEMNSFRKSQKNLKFVLRLCSLKCYLGWANQRGLMVNAKSK